MLIDSLNPWHFGPPTTLEILMANHPQWMLVLEMDLDLLKGLIIKCKAVVTA